MSARVAGSRLPTPALLRRSRADGRSWSAVLEGWQPWPVVAYIAGLVVVSLLLRTRALDASLWIDDAQTVGIATQPLGDIFGLLRLDGAPPLYYVLLSLWIDVFGSGEAAVAALALVFAMAAIGAGLWAGWSLFGRRAGLLCAGLVALSPLLTVLAEQARMYSLEVLLSLLATAAFAHAFVFRRRRYVGVFAVLLALLLYTHYWSLYLAVGTAAAAGWVLARSDDRRALGRDLLLAYAGAGVLFAPWLPTLAFQAAHTGAPWADIPDLRSLSDVPTFVVGVGLLAPLMLAAGAGLARLARRRRAHATAVVALLTAFCVTTALAWLASQVSPNWAPRYFAAVFGPLLLLAAAGLSRVGALGLACIVLAVPVWIGSPPTTEDYKSNARRVLAAVDDSLRPGDLVVSTQPEQVPVISYYLPGGLRYATPAGLVADPRVMDWRDGLERLRRASIATTLAPALDRLPAGRRVLLVEPIVAGNAGWRAPWTSLVRRRTRQWRAALASDPRFTKAASTSRSDGSVTFSAVKAAVYVKRQPRRR